MIQAEQVKQVLVINLGGIGDVLLSVPALRALKSHFPHAEISMLVVPRVYEIARSFSFTDKVYIFYNDIRCLFKDAAILFNLRRRHFDLAINMRTLVSRRGARKIKFILDFIRPKMTAGRDTEGRGWFFDIKIPEPLKGEKYEMEYDVDTVRALGAEVSDRNIGIKIDEESIKWIELILAQEGIAKTDILIGIHPGGRPTRRWPVSNFSEVINAVGNKTACKFIITGGKDEVSLANKLVRLSDIKVVNFSGKLSFPQLSALTKRCNVFISNDTGPMHIAASLKTPLVAIFGAGDIVRFDPRNISDKVIVLYKKAECAPCEKVKCRDLKCLKSVSAHEVVEAVLHLMRKNHC